jgi:hypothetical protein
MKQLMEFFTLLSLEDGLIGAAEFFEVFFRQIDAALSCVCPDVP